MSYCCSFCSIPAGRVKQLIQQDSVYICDGCVELCNDILIEDATPSTEIPTEDFFQSASSYSGRNRYHCSFCGKEMQEVIRLISGPGTAFICNECVVMCNKLLQEKIVGWQPQSISVRGAALIRTLRDLKYRARVKKMYTNH